MALVSMWRLFRVSTFILPYLVFVDLVIVFLPWPFISIALAYQLLSEIFCPEPHDTSVQDIYLPRLPEEVFEHIASYLQYRADRARFVLASQATYRSANNSLYRIIILDEHPSPNVPWFRRRLYRLYVCLTPTTASYIRHLDFTYYHDINEQYLLSVLKRSINLTSLSLPAIQEPIQSHLEWRGVLVKQPVFLTPALSIPIYSKITSLTWVGPFIPFRGPEHYTGRHALKLFPNLRSLKIIYRPDSFAMNTNTMCSNTLPPSVDGVSRLWGDLKSIASSCPLLEELTLPFWESVYSLVPMRFPVLRKVHFLALDGPMKDVEYGKGLLLFIGEMGKIGVQVTFLNPWQSQFDILSLVEELDVVANAGKSLQQLAVDNELTFGPIGPPRNVWQGRTDILNRLEWAIPSETIFDRRIMLKWPISTFEQPTFTVPRIFTGVEFLFNTPVRRGDAGQFLKFRRLLTEAVEIPHVRQIRIEMARIDAFYLAFPLFMQFLGNRRLTLQVERLLLPQRKGREACWIRRHWTIRRRLEDNDEVVLLEDLAKDEIHVHPARLFEKIMLGMLFSGERNVQEIICVFHDRYSRG